MSNTSKGSATALEKKELVIERVINAPRELVFKVWTEAEHLLQWWGPKGFKMKAAKLELRPDGVFHYGMEAPNGQTMWGKFVYREIVAPEKLVFVTSFADEEGNSIRHPLSATWPLEVLNTITFSEKDGKTTLRLIGVPVNASDEEHNTFNTHTESVKQGMGGTLDQLDEYLETL